MNANRGKTALFHIRERMSAESLLNKIYMSIDVELFFIAINYLSLHRGKIAPIESETVYGKGYRPMLCV